MERGGSLVLHTHARTHAHTCTHTCTHTHQQACLWCLANQHKPNKVAACFVLWLLRCCAVRRRRRRRRRQIHSAYLSGCVWDKCHTYETLAMAKMFCEIHSHACAGVTYVPTTDKESGGYQVGEMG